jgi:beta-lactam-binding protein with PASTA domain
VPNVVGSTKGTATAALKGSGFVVSVVYQPVANRNKDNIVLAQSPGAGTKKKTGSTVTITVGKFSPGPTPSPSPTKPGGHAAVQGFYLLEVDLGLDSTMFNLGRWG